MNPGRLTFTVTASGLLRGAPGGGSTPMTYEALVSRAMRSRTPRAPPIAFRTTPPVMPARKSSPFCGWNCFSSALVSPLADALNTGGFNT